MTGRKTRAVAASAVFLFAAPGLVAGLVPWWISRWKIRGPFLGISLFRVAGCALIALGLIGLLDSFLRFALQGLGSPAPAFPTQRLVVTGLYRHVRNPMYVAVVAVILGQGLWLGDTRLLVLWRSRLAVVSPLRGCLRRTDPAHQLR